MTSLKAERIAMKVSLVRTKSEAKKCLNFEKPPEVSEFFCKNSPVSFACSCPFSVKLVSFFVCAIKPDKL